MTPPPTSSSPIAIPATRADLPTICGWESEIETIVRHDEPIFLPTSNLDLDRVDAGFACALHMHQPTIPAGPDGRLIGNLQYMFERPGEGDNHNAGAFAWCYGRMGDTIPALVEDGCNPRIMLDYSGNLLWSLVQMGREDILDKLRRVTLDPRYQPHVEWLGTMWGHPVVPSTPIPDLKLHLQAWQTCFASIFGVDALRRVKGFSPPEMHLPGHPDTLYEYVKTLKEGGYRWLLVQEHSVENPDGSSLSHEQKYIPNRLVARDSRGRVEYITILIKTQGSDTKLVAQMQPYHEAKGRGRQPIGGIAVPSLVTQIADGENGGVMMNEFPRDFPAPWYEMRAGGTVAGFNGTEYIESIEAKGVNPDDYPRVQAIHQHQIWQRVAPDRISPEAVEAVIAERKIADPRFSMDGASWTSDLSWVRGYENVLEPMNRLSSMFHEKYDPLLRADPGIARRPDYQEALLYNLLLQTSCFRYWGQGIWTERARTLFERGVALLGRSIPGN